MKRKILLIGPMPPPSGGVSVHIARLAEMINATSDFECAVLDVGRLQFYDTNLKQRTIFNAVYFFLSAAIIHLHISHPRKYFIAKLSKWCGKKVVYTRHNIREEYSVADSKLHGIADAAIVVYQSSKNEADKKTKIIPAFIPNTKMIPLSSELKDQLGKFSSVIVAISTHPENYIVKIRNKDIYGFDLLLDAYSGFHRPGQVLVLLDANATMKETYSQKVERLNREGMPVIYLSSRVDFCSLLPFASIYVRPTRSDGDSLAIREALAVGVKVLASDCVRRPDGTFLFTDDDAVSLKNEMKKLIEGPQMNPIAQIDFSYDVLEVYRSL